MLLKIAIKIPAQEPFDINSFGGHIESTLVCVYFVALYTCTNSKSRRDNILKRPTQEEYAMIVKGND